MQVLIDKEKLIADIKYAEGIAGMLTLHIEPVERKIVDTIIEAILECIDSQPVIKSVIFEEVTANEPSREEIGKAMVHAFECGYVPTFDGIWTLESVEKLLEWSKEQQT